MKVKSKYIAFTFAFIFLIAGVSAAWNLGFVGISSTIFVSEGVSYVEIFETKTVDTTNSSGNSSNTLMVFNPDGMFSLQVVSNINITDDPTDSCFVEDDYNVSVFYNDYGVPADSWITILPGSSNFEIITSGIKGSCPAQVEVVLELIPLE